MLVKEFFLGYNNACGFLNSIFYRLYFLCIKNSEDNITFIFNLYTVIYFNTIKGTILVYNLRILLNSCILCSEYYVSKYKQLFCRDRQTRKTPSQY